MTDSFAASAFDPNVPFILTGQPEPNLPERVQFVQNANFAYPELATIVGESINCLLSALRYARGLPAEADSSEVNALRQLTIATVAIAAAEGEALLTLATCGLPSTARIHLRTLGECDLRLRAYREDKQFALRVYCSLVASQRDVVRFLDDDTIAAQLEQLMTQAVETSTDRKLTGGLLDGERQDAIALRKHEWHAWSKWSHADIVALGEIAHRLNKAPAAPSQRSITDDGKALFMLARATQFMLSILVSMLKIGVDVRPLFEDINTRFTTLVKSYGITDA